MTVQIVTGFIETANPRPRAEYDAHAKKLLMLPALKKVFVDTKLEQCWLHCFLKVLNRHVTHSKGDNAAKNTLEYHIIQHQKTQWMITAALDSAADVFVWIDYGIFHIPGVTAAVIKKFLEQAEGETGISIPGCWDQEAIAESYPCWRFCGGLIVCARDHLFQLDKAIKIEAMNSIIRNGNVSWEVNTWARVERNKYPPIRWYKADHNQTMFTDYMGSSDAS